MKRILPALFPLLTSLLYAQPNAGYQLVWQDDFNGSGINEEYWSFSLGDGCPEVCGWGNNELQYYTDSHKNARIENGSLIIEAHHEKMEGYRFSSAKLISKDKVDIQYGKIEIKAKIPDGLGTWAAFWMLPTLDRPLQWPADGEIDLMEHIGFNAGTVYGTIHTQKYNHMVGTQKSDSIAVLGMAEAFHLYEMEWTQEEMVWYVDHQEYHRIKRGEDGPDGWPFDQYRYHIIMNLAVGGYWGGKKGVDVDSFPERMEIDYVRYFERMK